MGEPADSALSPQQEKLLGREFMRQIRAQLPLIRDTLSNEYVNNLGQKLVASAENRGDGDFNFFIINDISINAFAIPGGYIGINAGLVDAMRREEQLAGVIAHEVAHVTQRHHARAFASAGKNRMSTAAAILAAIVIGASSPEAGQAALAAGLAISQQTSINYTRAHEYEADRIGIRILSDANLDPAAIAETFEILRRRNSLNTSSDQIEYLRTHPLDSNRIAEARSRASGLDKPTHANPQLDFALFKARLAVLASRDNATVQRTLQARFARDANHADAYALALIDTRSKNFKRAEEYLQGAVDEHPDNLYIRLLQAQLLFEQKREEESLEIHEQLLSVYPGRYPVVEQYADQLVSQRRLEEAAQLLRRYQRSTASPNTLAWRELANIQERLGLRSESHESLAHYFLELNELARAQQQLELALRETDRGSSDELRLTAQLRQVRKQLER
ncbi:MAG: M48 family metalloprotease [Gammaproteobacteria bacterium]|nr:M48 family metalloprotease [Gammaproteobacteria bacterium]